MEQASNELTRDVCQLVTRQIIEAIEEGVATWTMPWHVTGESAFSPANVESRRPYRGINLLCLWASAIRRGFASGTWGTYRQWKERGAQVKGGERATTVVFWKFSDEAEGDAEEGEKEDARKERRKGRGVYATGYPVFNADQVEGYTPPVVPTLSPAERVEGAEAFFRKIPADVRHGGDAAYYLPSEDFIALPRFEYFKTPSGYYGVLAHELTHWTGAAHRLSRDLSGRFGTRCYAAEELVAELGAAFVCSGLGLSLSTRNDHAPYIAQWLELFKADKRAIFTAASRAQQAADYLLTVHQASTREAA